MPAEFELDYETDPLFDRRIMRALETQPQPHVPPDFAARVSALAAARFGPPPSTRSETRFGMLALRVGLAALLVAMILVARVIGSGSVTILILEVTLCAEFVGLAAYLGLQQNALG